MTSLREFSHTLAAYVIGVRDDGGPNADAIGTRPNKTQTSPSSTVHMARSTMMRLD
jgi:hypothetical protein